MEVSQQTAEALTALDLTLTLTNFFIRLDDLVAKALMISFLVNWSSESCAATRIACSTDLTANEHSIASQIGRETTIFGNLVSEMAAFERWARTAGAAHAKRRAAITQRALLRQPADAAGQRGNRVAIQTDHPPGLQQVSAARHTANPAASAVAVRSVASGSLVACRSKPRSASGHRAKYVVGAR